MDRFLEPVTRDTEPVRYRLVVFERDGTVRSSVQMPLNEAEARCRAARAAGYIASVEAF